MVSFEPQRFYVVGHSETEFTTRVHPVSDSWYFYRKWTRLEIFSSRRVHDYSIERWIVVNQEEFTVTRRDLIRSEVSYAAVRAAVRISARSAFDFHVLWQVEDYFPNSASCCRLRTVFGMDEEIDWPIRAYLNVFFYCEHIRALEVGRLHFRDRNRPIRVTRIYQHRPWVLVSIDFEFICLTRLRRVCRGYFQLDGAALEVIKPRNFDCVLVVLHSACQAFAL